MGLCSCLDFTESLTRDGHLAGGLLRFGAHGHRGRAAPILVNTRYVTIPPPFQVWFLGPVRQ
jgi:hypothetical protein